jgi:hypothetical protein
MSCDDDILLQTEVMLWRAKFVHLVLNLKNHTFCSHNVFICFVWISEQTAIISVYSIN